MRALFANVKHLYQCFPIFAIGLTLTFGFFGFLVITDLAAYGTFPGILAIYLMPPVLAASLVGMNQSEIFAKPFSFCLPRHRRVSFLYIVLLGCLVSFVSGGLGLRYCWVVPPWLENFSVYLSATSLAMAVYAVVVTVAIIRASFLVNSVIFVLPLILLVIPILPIAAIGVTLRAAIVEGRVITIPLCLLITCFAYFRLIKSDFPRKCCGSPGLFSALYSSEEALR